MSFDVGILLDTNDVKRCQGGAVGGGSRWGNLGWWWGGGGGEAPLTSPCPPSNHTITINLSLPSAARARVRVTELVEPVLVL